VTLGLCNITAKLPSEGHCSWPPENRSVAHKEGRGPRLRNPGIEYQWLSPYYECTNRI